MIDLVKRLFSGADAQPKRHGAPDQDRVLVATCALLLEIAAIDGEFSAPEQDAIMETLERTYGLGSRDAASILEEARSEVKNGIDLWRFARVINQEFSETEKITVIESVWKVIYADSRLDGHEDHLVHRLAGLLRLSHSQLIETKLRVKNPS